MKNVKQYVQDHKSEIADQAERIAYYTLGYAVGIVVGYKVCSIRHKSARKLVEMIHLIPSDELWVCMRKGDRFSVATAAEKLFTGKPM